MPRKAMTSELGLQGRTWDGMAPSTLMADVRVFAGSILASALAISVPLLHCILLRAGQLEMSPPQRGLEGPCWSHLTC